MIDSRVFLPAGFFMFRSPLLPVEYFLENCSKKLPNQVLYDYFSHPLIQEAILLASPSLYFSLKKDIQNKKTLFQKSFSSLLRYLIRMSTRPTPFGLFAAIGFGTIDQKTHIFLSTEQKKFARPNMQWLYEVINSLEKDITILENCKVKTNSPILSCAGRLFLSGSRDLEKMKHDERSIKKSVLTDFIMKNSSQWILYKDLEDKLIQEFSSLNKDKLKSVLRNMFKNQFIISELTPNLLSNNPFACFLGHLKNIDPQAEDGFKPLNTYLEQYNATTPGYGLQLLEKTNELLHKIHPKKNSSSQNSSFLQVDTAFSSNNTLTYKVAEEAALAATLIWKIGKSNLRKKKLGDYHGLFLEKYGTDQLIPFFELINENIGLGIPSCYLTNEGIANHLEKNTSFEWFLSKKYQEAVYLGKKEVVLIDDEIQHYLAKHPYTTDAPTSLEIFCEILAMDQTAIDNGDFNLILGLSQASPSIGSTFGRFLHVLPKEAKAKLLKAYAFEQKLVPKKIFVKFSWLPASSAVGNIMIGKNLRDFSLVFPPNSKNISTAIAHDDLYVGASQKGLYLFSKQLNQEIILSTDNVVNQDFAPFAFKLLLDISKESTNPIQSIYWDQFDYFSYLPRLRYNKTYLSLARWYLCTEDLSLDVSKANLIVWLKKWNVPRFIIMVDHDQYLLLDVEKENHLAQILSNLLKHGKVCLIEKGLIKESTWARSNKGAHFVEIVIPLLKNQSLATKIPIDPQPKREAQQPSKKRIRRLGSAWVYIKLFCCKTLQEEFLQRAFPSLIQEIVKKKACEKWFYIRYEEKNATNPHIRLRIKAPHSQLLQIILSIIYNWSEQLIQESFLKDVSFHSYERELERYGGVNLIELTETLFHVDSMACIALLQNYSKIAALPLYGIAALSIIDLLASLNLPQEDQITLLRESVSSKKALEGFPLHKKQLFDIASIKADKTNPFLLKQIFSMRHLACQSYAKKTQAEHIDLLSSKGKKILRSLVHMHCNRLLGTDLYLEEKSILFAAETIKRFYALEKKKLRSC